MNDADIAAPLKFFKQQPDFETGIEMALRAVLVSPEFLFRVEADQPTSPPKPPTKSATSNSPRA